MQDVVSGCPIEDAMRVLSGRWATLLLYYLKDRPKRFSELQRDNPTISHRILTLELRKLEEAGLIERTAYEGFPLQGRVPAERTGRRADADDRRDRRLVGSVLPAPPGVSQRGLGP